jgi:hypothetical protein
MSPLRHTVAILVVVAIFTSAAGVPRPEEAKKEADNIIPQVGGDLLLIATEQWFIADKGLLALRRATRKVQTETERFLFHKSI